MIVFESAEYHESYDDDDDDDDDGDDHGCFIQLKGSDTIRHYPLTFDAAAAATAHPSYFGSPYLPSFLYDDDDDEYCMINFAYYT